MGYSDIGDWVRAAGVSVYRQITTNREGLTTMDYSDICDWVRTACMLLIATLVFGGLGCAIFIGAEKEKQWHVWASAHCKVIEKREGQTISTTGLSSTGHMLFGSSYIGGQTEYQCDDGVTYWKDY